MKKFSPGTGFVDHRKLPLVIAVICLATLLQMQPTYGSQSHGDLCLNGSCNSDYCGTSADYCGNGSQSGNCTGDSRYEGRLLRYIPRYVDTSKIHGAREWVLIGLGLASLVFLILLFCCCRRRQPEVVNRHVEMVADESGGGHLRTREKLNCTIFSSYTLSSATIGFEEELDHGAFGEVYKGTLQDGRDIAVKKLRNNEQGLEDFEAEVWALGKINHANLVALLGFCFPDKKPFLIYEYVSNGPLNRWLFEKDKTDKAFVLPWKTRVAIMKGTARGLAYLHENLQIIHLHIKPENILLGEGFVPKVADFGMAKLVGASKTIQTVAFGDTPGYMAPEILIGAAAAKMDVYSFGMVALEVLSGRRHLDKALPKDSAFLPAWAVRKVIRGEYLDVIDPLLREGAVDAEEATRLIVVALLCLQRHPDDRPEMSRLLNMLDGPIEISSLPSTLQSDLESTERLMVI